MQTVGEFLKDARLSKNVSINDLQKLTKIKRDFILAIEKGNWESLPELPIISGFVKNISLTLDVSDEKANALLRRDYIPKKLMISPKPDLEKKITWTPKLTFALGLVFVVLVVLGYLSFEYFKFIKPPELTIIEPKENEVILTNRVFIKGSTSGDSVLTVNNQPVIINEDGEFDSQIEVDKNTKTLEFKSVSRSGKETKKLIDISVE